MAARELRALSFPDNLRPEVAMKHLRIPSDLRDAAFADPLPPIAISSPRMELEARPIRTAPGEPPVWDPQRSLVRSLIRTLEGSMPQ